MRLPAVLTSLLLLVGIAATSMITPQPARAAPSQPQVAGVKTNFRGHISGTVIYFNPSGFEPDFDLIDRVIFELKVTSRQAPAMTLILDAYLENFQYDTTPVLPDLIRPSKLVSTTLGGFFSGKAIIVGPSNTTLYVGAMLAEAFIQPRGIQHMVLLQMPGQGPARGGSIRLDSVFHVNKSFDITGSLYGRLSLPGGARAFLRRGGGHLTAAQVLKDFQVARPLQRGTAGSGRRAKGYCFNGHCTNQGTGASSKPGSGHTGFGAGHSGDRGTAIRPTWMTILGIALIALAFVLLAYFFWEQRRHARPKGAESGTRAGTATD